MEKKGAIEFSVNFIVILIIAIITFIFGIYIFTQIFAGGEEFTGQVSEEVQERINELLITGRKPLIIPDVVKEVKQNKVATFPLGIKHDPKLCVSNDFEVIVQYDTAVSGRGEEMNLDPAQMRTWHFEPSEYKIEKNQREVIPVPIRPGAGAAGGWTYVFNIGVKCGGSDELYGGLQKVYVRIK